MKSLIYCRNNHLPALALRVPLFHIHPLDGSVHLIKIHMQYIKVSLLLKMNIKQFPHLNRGTKFRGHRLSAGSPAPNETSQQTLNISVGVSEKTCQIQCEVTHYMMCCELDAVRTALNLTHVFLRMQTPSFFLRFMIKAPLVELLLVVFDREELLRVRRLH